MNWCQTDAWINICGKVCNLKSPERFIVLAQFYAWFTDLPFESPLEWTPADPLALC